MHFMFDWTGGFLLNESIMIECKEHRQWLDQKPAPYTDYQLTHMVKSYNKLPKHAGGYQQVVANEQALAKLTANKWALLKTSFHLTRRMKSKGNKVNLNKES